MCIRSIESEEVIYMCIRGIESEGSYAPLTFYPPNTHVYDSDVLYS
jgi:hypothetical protein